MDQVIENDDVMTIDASNYDSIIKPFKFTGHKSSMSSLTILNQPIYGVKLMEIWNNTNLHVCADGGANQLYDYWSNDRRQAYIPDFIVGDLDLIRDDVKQYYQQHGTRIIPQYNQYSSDFMKAMKLILLHFNGIDITHVDDDNGLSLLMQDINNDHNDKLIINSYVLNGLGGRFDQTIQSIHQILSLHEKFPNLKNIFINQQDLVMVVPKGRTLIHYNSIDEFYRGNKHPIIGLLPFLPCTITSFGLKWDVRNWHTTINSKISTSNGIVSTNGIIIQSDADLVVNIEHSNI